MNETIHYNGFEIQIEDYHNVENGTWDFRAVVSSKTLGKVGEVIAYPWGVAKAEAMQMVDVAKERLNEQKEDEVEEQVLVAQGEEMEWQAIKFSDILDTEVLQRAAIVMAQSYAVDCGYMQQMESWAWKAYGWACAVERLSAKMTDAQRDEIGDFSSMCETEIENMDNEF